MANVLSVSIYQIDGQKLASPQTFGLPVSSITRDGVFPTRIPGTMTRLENTVDPSIYGVVGSGINVRNGRNGFKVYFANEGVAAIVTRCNA